VKHQETTGKTRLTEDQARALADWWGGVYHRLRAAPPEVGILHGVVWKSGCEAGSLGGEPGAPAVFFLEEACHLDNRRGEINPGAPDWVP
jgi:hypothetical protein